MLTRTLTHDERKAAEAAFRGIPCDPTWSAAARAVYDGIINAAQGKAVIAEPVMTDSPQSALLQSEETGVGEGPLEITTREEAMAAFSTVSGPAAKYSPNAPTSRKAIRPR